MAIIFNWNFYHLFEYNNFDYNKLITVYLAVSDQQFELITNWGHCLPQILANSGAVSHFSWENQWLTAVLDPFLNAAESV